MKNYLYRIFRPVIEHLSEWKVAYILSIFIVSPIFGVIYCYEPASDPDTYQICPKYSGNRCELLSMKDWEREDVFGFGGTNRFYNKHDPHQIKVFRYCNVRNIRMNDYGK